MLFNGGGEVDAKKYLENENQKGPNSKELILPFEVKEVTEEGRIEGYGSTFGGKPDSYRDIVVKGAFKETIERGGRNGTGIPMLWQHNFNEPIGLWDTLAENSKGLKAGGNLVMEVQRAREAHALAKAKVITGLSMGWDFLRDKSGVVEKDAVEFDDNKKIRYLKKVELWEISPVTFPANINANITNVKCLIEQAENERELEHALREVGISKTAAEYLVSICKEGLKKTGKIHKKEEQEDMGYDHILKALKEVNAEFYVRRKLNGSNIRSETSRNSG